MVNFVIYRALLKVFLSARCDPSRRSSFKGPILHLRHCLGMTKLNYCWTTNPDYLESNCKGFKTYSCCTGQGLVPFRLRLPLCLGIPLPSDIKSFAYISSMYSSLSFQQQIFPSLPPNPPPEANTFVQQFSTKYAPDIQLITNMFAAPSKLQKQLAHLYFSYKLDMLNLEINTMEELYSKQQKAIFLSNRSPMTFQGLLALPNGGLGQK